MNRHPSMRPEIQRRRNAEYDACTNSAEHDALQQRWLVEDELLERQASVEGQELVRLRAELNDAQARISRLEKMFLSKDGKNFSERLVDVIGTALGMVRKELLAEIPRFTGVHEAGSLYKRNSLTIRKGGLWIATEDTTVPPGSGQGWQLVVKSGNAGGQT